MKETILEEKNIKTIIPVKEGDLVSMKLYYLTSQPPSEEQVWNSPLYDCHLRRFMNAQNDIVKLF